MRSLFLFCLALLSPPSLDAGEWRALFDGKSLDGWMTRSGQPVPDGWKIEGGALHRAAKAGDIVTREEFLNFELGFEWKVAPGANGGLKYRVADYSPAGQNIGLEFQLLDDAKHANGTRPQTSAASLYDLIAPKKSKTLKPPGEWNSSKIVARGNTLEHWLNGEDVLRVEIGTPDWQEALRKSKFRAAADFGTKRGRILLQDHGDEVWFRNIRIRELEK